MKSAVYVKGKKQEAGAGLNNFPEEEIGIFETLRVYSGKIFRLEEHLDRLEESAKTSGYTFPLNRKVLRGEVVKAVHASGQKEAFVRVTLLQGQAFVFVGERTHSEALYRKGVCLQTTAVKRLASNASFPEAKTTAYQNGVLASLEVRSDATYEWLFLDQAGYVTEVRIGNLFMVASGNPNSKLELQTPPLVGILNGVTRRFVIECARDLGIPVRESPLTRHDIFNAGEAFLTNTSWEILPVRALDGRLIGRGIPGKLTLKLHKHFKKKVARECQRSSYAAPSSASRIKQG